MIELLFARLLVRWKAWRTSRAEAERVFARERDAILGLVKNCDPASLSTPVLIKRPPGLEDSSRYWSVLMVLDHLRIMNSQVSGVISLLVKGKVPAKVASTAAVKPDRNVDVAVMAAFEKGCHTFEQTVADLPNLTTKETFRHPWFGPMNAAEWHFMAGFHMALHRKQIELILAGLPQRK